MVKYLELIDQNKIRLILNTASKVCKFPGLVSSHSFLTFLPKFQISKVQALNFKNLEFEQNCFYIGGGYTRPLKIVATLFNLTVYLSTSN